MVILNKKFYSLDAINSTKDAFKDVCSVLINDKGDSFELMFHLIDKTETLHQVELEFCNYCLGMMK